MNKEMSMDSLLDVRNLTVRYRMDDPERPVHAVENVSFSMNEGESLGLVGESGCGKTATCRTILRLLAPNADIAGGEVRYKGTDLLKLSEPQMRKIRGSEIGMIFQEPMTALNPVLTIKKQLYEALGSGLSRKDKYLRAVELLSMVGIASPEKRLNEYIHQFSGGMRQRIMIAITLAAGPGLLLADEPTTALDVTIQDQIIKLLRRLKKQLGMSVVLITHDLGVVCQLCDKVVVMYAGQVMETAAVGDLFHHPGHPYTVGLLNSIPDSTKKECGLQPVPGSPPDLAAMPAGCPFAPRCSRAAAACRTSLPPLRQTGADHYVRCWYAVPADTEEDLSC